MFMFVCEYELYGYYILILFWRGRVINIEIVRMRFDLVLFNYMLVIC